MTDSATAKPVDDPARQVRDFLLDNPGFLREQPDLLRSIDIPHLTGADASLIEHQVRRLRADNQALQARILELAENARVNERLADRLLELCLDLMAADSADQVVATTRARLAEEFEVAEVRFLLLDCPGHLRGRLDTACGDADGERLLRRVLKNGQANCQPLRRADKALLFDRPAEIRSTALIPLTHGRDLGVMALGRPTPDGFQPSMGTHFLDQLGRIVSGALVRFWDAD